jgi:Uncharacterized conserved protein
MFNFPAHLEAQPEGGFTVTFRDVPEAITQGDSREEALSEAVDALVTAMEFYFDDGRPVPSPSKARKGEEEVTLPVSISAKVLLLNAMLEERKRPADLARAMRVKPQEVNRIMDLHHATKIDTVADALRALGRRFDLRVV